MEQLTAAIEALTATIGNAPLPRLMEDSAALVRAHFARIALARCGNDAQRAASLLGVDPGFFGSGGSILPAPAGRRTDPESS